MATTVSRRFVFVKMKRKRPMKPKPPVRDDDELVGEAARPTRPFLGPSLVVVKPKSQWPLIAAAIGGVVAVAGIVALLATLSSRPSAPASSSSPTETSRSGGVPTYPGYGGRSSSGGGYPGGGASASPSRPSPTAQGFLASPFPKRKPTSCSVQIDGSKESLRDFNKCLEQANERDTAPAAR